MTAEPRGVSKSLLWMFVSVLGFLLCIVSGTLFAQMNASIVDLRQTSMKQDERLRILENHYAAIEQNMSSFYARQEDQINLLREHMRQR